MQTLREHQRWMLGREIAGRIYISAQGINAQYSGPTEDALAYARWVAAQPGFEVPLATQMHDAALGMGGHGLPSRRWSCLSVSVQAVLCTKPPVKKGHQQAPGAQSGQPEHLLE